MDCRAGIFRLLPQVPGVCIASTMCGCVCVVCKTSCLLQLDFSPLMKYVQFITVRAVVSDFFSLYAR